MSTYPLSPRSRHERRPPPPPPHEPEHDGVAGRIGPAPDAYDALADMFLGEIGATEGNGTAAAKHVRDEEHTAPADADLAPVELLILGHLPVMASAWASHYVRHAAGAAKGPVASLRLAGGAAWLELMNAPVAMPAAHSLNAALRAARVARYWVIRTDAGRERDLVQHQRVTRVTLLTGCNEAATVDAYRAIKQLVAEQERLPALRIAVLGGTAAACRQAADRICDACQAFLEVEIEAVTCPGAIGGGMTGVELYHGPAEVDERLVLDRLGAIRRSEGFDEEMQQSGPSPESVQDGAEQELVPRPAADSNPSEAAGTGKLVAPAAALDLPRPEDLGLRPLGTACPYEPTVQLARDESGGLHLIVQAREPAQIDAAVRSLSVVAAWATDHRQLLVAAGACDEGQPIQRHLLTESPREARRLLDTDIRVHLCASAARMQHGWVVADLN